MRADKVLRAILKRESITYMAASRKMGRTESYLGSIISKGTIPRVDSMARICDALGYDLLARSRDDGFEFYIDPPEE